jgi:hypothetical protein
MKAILLAVVALQSLLLAIPAIDAVPFNRVAVEPDRDRQWRYGYAGAAMRTATKGSGRRTRDQASLGQFKTPETFFVCSSRIARQGAPHEVWDTLRTSKPEPVAVTFLEPLLSDYGKRALVAVFAARLKQNLMRRPFVLTSTKHIRLLAQEVSSTTQLLNGDVWRSTLCGTPDSSKGHSARRDTPI